MEAQVETEDLYRSRSFVAIVLAYLAAFAAGAIAITLLAAYAPLVQIAVADLAATLTLFIFARLHRNSSVFDASWSVIPIAIVGYLLGSYGITARGALIGAAVTVWGIRLTYNWARSFPGLHHEDFRYRDLKARARAFAPSSIFSAFISFRVRLSSFRSSRLGLRFPRAPRGSRRLHSSVSASR